MDKIRVSQHVPKEKLQLSRDSSEIQTCHGLGGAMFQTVYSALSVRKEPVDLR